MSLAKVTLIGNLGRDPETRYTPNGTMNVRFTMATNRKWRDQSGQDQEKTTWFSVTAWGRLAETLDSLTQQGILAKGRQVYVEGRIEAREYTDQNGQLRTSLDVTANELQLLGGRGDAEGGQGAPRGAGGSGGGGRVEESGGEPDWNDVPF
jgi:single-strand DNA-binding protein